MISKEYSNNLNIGVFDSGLGGLTVVKALRDIIRDAHIIYIADTANAPYGEKSHDEIRHFSESIAKHLINKHNIDALVVACNTATSAAISHLRSLHPHLHIVGTEPGIKPALHITNSNNVGILATPATLKGDKYQELADKLYNGTEVTLFEQACPGLVEQIESGDMDSNETKEMLGKWLDPMSEAGVDTIVLGCTHYPLVSDAIQQIMGNEINLIETGDAIANRLKTLLGIDANGAPSSLSVYATGEINNEAVAKILGEKVDVRRVDVAVSSIV